MNDHAEMERVAWDAAEVSDVEVLTVATEFFTAKERAAFCLAAADRLADRAAEIAEESHGAREAALAWLRTAEVAAISLARLLADRRAA